MGDSTGIQEIDILGPTKPLGRNPEGYLAI